MTATPLEPLVCRPCQLGRHAVCREPRCECSCNLALTLTAPRLRLGGRLARLGARLGVWS